LSELLAAVIQSAGKWLDLLVDNFVRPHVSTLRECFTTNVTLIRTLAGVASFVGLKRY
jgi:hypothetical protein